MLVPSMNLEEIRKEFLKDYEIVMRKAGYVVKDQQKTRKHSRNKEFDFTYDYYSKYKNYWICNVSSSGKNDISDKHLVYYYNKTGLVALTYDRVKDILHYHTAHFFNRYNERMKLGLIKPYDIMRHYFDRTNNIMYHHLGEIDAGIHKIFGVAPNGMVLGTHHIRLKFLKFNTFLTEDLLLGDQHERKDFLIKSLDKYLSGADKTDELKMEKIIPQLKDLQLKNPKPDKLEDDFFLLKKKTGSP